MAEEYNYLLANGTQDLVPHNPLQNLASSKSVFRVKNSYDEFVEWCKARRVARGFHQQAGIDYRETCFPVVTLSPFALFFL